MPARRGDSPSLRLIAAFFAVGVLASCGDSSDPCFEDRSCERGQRCEGASLNTPGMCVACDDVEIPYDGIDNDCSTRTPDLDLDGDGQNAASSPVMPGGDCDDENAAVFQGAPELCGDGVDSDCDGLGGPGAGDDPDCGDTELPTLTVLSPASGERVAGIVTLRLRLEDDTGINVVAVRAGNIALPNSPYPFAPMPSQEVEIEFDSRRWPDGNLTLTFEGRDRADRAVTATLVLFIDNAPEVTIVEPRLNVGYRGPVRLTVQATDPDGVDVDSAVVRFDGAPANLIGTSTVPLQWLVDTSGLADGRYGVEVAVPDLLGNVATSSVTFRLDSTPPELMLMEPVAGATVTDTITVTWTASDPSGVSGVSGELPGGGSTGAATFMLDTTFFPNGPLVLSATAADGAIGPDGQVDGNVGRGSAVVFLDNTDIAPMVEILQPVANAEVVGPTRIELNIDGGNSMNQVELVVDGVLVGRIPRPPWEADIDLRAPRGPRTLEAIVTDGRGRTGRDQVALSQVEAPVLRMAGASRSAGSVISDLRVADFDGDGVLDYVTAASEIELHAGRLVNGRFVAAAPVVLSRTRLVQFVLVDVDNDDDLDVVGTSGTRLIMLLQDAGGLGSATIVANLPSGTDRIDAHDVDGDGDPDLVLAGATNPAAQLYTLDAGTFSLAQTIGGDGDISDVQFEHADTDGNIDIVAGRQSTRTISVFRGNGAGTFGAGLDSQPTAAPQSIAVGEVTGDMFPDLIAGTNDGVQVLAGLMNGGFASPVIGAGTAEDDVLVVNLDGDTPLEIVSLDDSARAAVVWNATSMPVTVEEDRSWLIGEGARILRAADVDADGQMDVLVARGREVVRVKTSTAGAAAARVVRPGFRIRTLDVGALVGGDSIPDMVVFDDTDLEIKVLQGDGQLGFTSVFSTPRPNLAQSVEALRIGRIDANTSPDIAVGFRVTLGGNARGALLQTGLNQFTGSYFVGDDPVDVVIADSDGDGMAELGFVVTSNQAVDNGLDIVAPDGTSEASLRLNLNAVNAAKGQFDSSVSSDQIAVSNRATENVTIHTWQTSGYTSRSVNAVTGLSRITVGRIGTDTLDDIIGVGGNRLFFLEAAAPPLFFLPPVVFDLREPLVEARAVDVNKDGIPDLVAVSDRTLFVLIASGPRSFFDPIRYVYARSAARLFVADLDGDGREDLLTHHPSSQTLVAVPTDGDRF